MVAPTHGMVTRVWARRGRLWSGSWVRNALNWGLSCCRAAPGDPPALSRLSVPGPLTVLQEVVTL